MPGIKKKSNKTFSLVHPMAMGGIYGGDGYTFQDRFIVCTIPKWISDQTFIKIMPEGTGDVDVVFRDGRKHIYDHIQVKDHTVNTTEFREVIESFVKIDRATKKIYRKFFLATPSVNAQVKSFYKLLERYRHGKKLYDPSDRKALKTTEAELKRIFTKLGLKSQFNFIVIKLELQIGSFDFNDNNVCKQMFISGLLEHPKYKERIAEILKPAYSILIEQVLAHRGKVLDQSKIHSFIDSVISGTASQLEANVLHVHNWTAEKYDLKATHTLDWTPVFDRQTRTIPSEEVWNKTLVPELYQTKDKISRKTSNRHIVFRGKTTLTTGVALGIVFPEIGNWTFELIQPPQIISWKSDANKIKKYKLDHEEIEPGSVGLEQKEGEIVVIFNITGKALNEVVAYFKAMSFGIKAIILIQPVKGSGNFSIQNDSEAVTLASAAKEILKEKILKYKARKTHLFFYGPLGLAIFLGQKLTAVGEIQLYEFKDPGYKPSASIKT